MRKKTLGCLALILLSSIFIGGCSTDSNQSHYYRSSVAESNLVASPTAVVYAPSEVVIYDAKETPTVPSEEITTIQVDLYNEYGIMRQQAQINQMLKEQACSLGGNAVVVEQSTDKNHCTAKVIKTEPTGTSTSGTSS